MQILVRIEADVFVESDSADAAMDMVERGEIEMNPCVLMRCPAQGVGRLVDTIRKIRFGPDQ